MNIDDIIKMAKADVKLKKQQLKWLCAHRQLIEQCGVQYISFCGGTIDIDNPTRDQVLAVIKALPGDWEKKVIETSQPPTLSYTCEVDGMPIRLWAAPPPPSCRLIEELVDVPATQIKRFRLDCTPASQLTNSTQA